MMVKAHWALFITLNCCFHLTYGLLVSGLYPNISGVNLSLEDRDDSLLTWKAPKHIVEMFPYYVSGYDLEKRPMELGKWPLRPIIEKGGEDYEQFRTYVKQFMYRFEKGAELLITISEQDLGADGSVCITDFEDFSLAQITHQPTLRFCMSYFSSFQKIQQSLAYGFFINVNTVAQMLLDLSRPLLNSSMERTEVYGTTKEKWIHKLLRKIESNQLPPQYGGSRGNFKPLTTFGDLIKNPVSALAQEKVDN